MENLCDAIQGVNRTECAISVIAERPCLENRHPRAHGILVPVEADAGRLWYMQVAVAQHERLLHHAHVVAIRGDSYRLREKRRAGVLICSIPVTAQEPTRRPEAPANCIRIQCRKLDNPVSKFDVR